MNTLITRYLSHKVQNSHDTPEPKNVNKKEGLSEDASVILRMRKKIDVEDRKREGSG